MVYRDSAVFFSEPRQIDGFKTSKDTVKTDLGIGKARILSMTLAPDGYGLSRGRGDSRALLKICSAHPEASVHQ